MKDKLFNLIQALENLKTIFEVPKLFICNYFNELRNRIDLSAIRFIMSKRKLLNENEDAEKHKLEMKQINENWIMMIHKIMTLEKECYQNYTDFSSIYNHEVKEAIKLIENQLTNDLNDLNKLEELIYDQKFKLEKILLMNKSLIFVEKETCKIDELFSKMDLGSTFGKLIIVQNDYFGSKGIDFLTNKFCNGSVGEKLNRNELIKSSHFLTYIKEKRPKPKPQQQLTSNLVDDLSVEYSKLTYMNMSNQSFVSLDKGVFKDLNDLSQIQLNGNQIASLHSSTFHNLSNLTYLRLNSNRLTFLDPFLFAGLISLNELYLNDNQLSSIDSRQFNGLKKLEICQLHGNNLTTIDPHLFNGLLSLTQITLNNNQLTTIHPETFQNLPDLQKIDLYSNKLTAISPILFKGLNKLTELDLHHNCLKELDPMIFQGLDKLVMIRLDANRFSTLHPELFKDQTSLISIGLSFNFLTFIDIKLFSSNQKLKQIDLANNHLISVDKYLFKGLTSLTCVYLSNNKFANKKLELFLEKSVDFVSFKRNTYENNITEILV